MEHARHFPQRNKFYGHLVSGISLACWTRTTYRVDKSFNLDWHIKKLSWNGQMANEEMIRVLCNIMTRDESGVHFMDRYPQETIEALEAARLIVIERPLMESFDVVSSREYWTVELTERGKELVGANPELQPTEYE